MAAQRRAIRAGRAFVLALGLTVVAEGPARPELVGTAFREVPDSFTWELAWDGAAAGPAVLRPERAEGEAGSECWLVSVRTAPLRRGAARLVVQARHACRVHDLDAPQGPLCRIAFALALTPAGSKDWSRVERRALDHLATPKDHPDTVDVFWRWASDAEGRRSVRLVVQGGHGPPGRAKKTTKGKGGKGS